VTSYRHLELHRCGSVFVVRVLSCRLRYACDQKVEELAAEWTDVADRGDCQTLWLDCSQVEFVSSGTLAKLIQLRQRLQQKAGRLVLCGIRRGLHEVLTRTHLDLVFEIAEEREEGAASYDVCASHRDAIEIRDRCELAAASWSS